METWKKREGIGGVPYHKRFEAMLKILHHDAEVAIAFSCWTMTPLLPSVSELRSFPRYYSGPAAHYMLTILRLQFNVN